MRRLARLALGLWSAGLAAAALWALAQNPLAAPVVERTAAEARIALKRAMARSVTPEWLLPRLQQATAEADRDRVAMLAGLARDHGVALPDDLGLRVAETLAEPDWTTRAADCAACAWDIRSCPTLGMITTCALPVELTPAGDANALRRQSGNWIAGEQVDSLETGLALVGLGATAVVVYTGGSSALVKLGATAARLARRLGTLGPGLTRMLREAADVPVAWDKVAPFLLGRVPLSEVADVSRLARLGPIVQDIGTVARNTSPAEALLLLRHVEGAEDAARLARLSEAAGPATRASLEVLGPARAFRTLARVTDLAITAIGLVAAAVGQIGALLASLALGRLRRLAARRPVAPRGKPRHDRAP